ncbi:hypothetical protein [Flaviaesturariibacter amylovorans]|uniref:Uncharacterized protein n=1 Tax=Flaviaesturariibacter amylovorans TaxID=1084520 RepID=A0ABP8GUU3_9BACT
MTDSVYALNFSHETDGNESCYFGGWSTLEATRLFQPGHPILQAHVLADSGAGYLDEAIVSTFTTMGSFTHFFATHPGIRIHDASLLLEGGLRLGSHDDGEVHLSAPAGGAFDMLVERLLEVKELPASLLATARLFPGAYLAIDPSGTVLSIHETFAEYLDHYPG